MTAMEIDCVCVTAVELIVFVRQPGSTSLVKDHIKNVENILGVTPHKQSIAAMLQPGHKLRIKIGFQPRDDLARSSLILIRYSAIFAFFSNLSVATSLELIVPPFFRASTLCGCHRHEAFVCWLRADCFTFCLLSYSTFVLIDWSVCMSDWVSVFCTNWWSVCLSD